jgi:type VI protein secretion system component Hcp
MFKLLLPRAPQWKIAAIVVAIGATLTGGSSVAHAFNPQPDPPGDRAWQEGVVSLPPGTLTIDGNNIEIDSFSFGVENTLSIGSATGGAGAGKVTFHPFTIKKTVDANSIGLFRAAESGQHYQNATLNLRKPGGQTYLVFHFSAVFVGSIDWSGSGDEAPKETVVFEYGGLQAQYTSQDGTSQSTDPLAPPPP